MRRALALATTLAVLAPAGARAASPDELSARIASARRLAEAGEDAPSPDRMAAVRDALGLPDAVAWGAGSLRVPDDPFLARLEGDDARDFSLALRRLDALAARLEGAPRPAAGVREDLRRAYGDLRDTEPGPLGRLRRLVGSVLSGLARGAGDALTGAPALWILLAVAGGAVVLLLRGRRLALVPEAAADLGTAAPSPAEWRRLADAARARGDLAEAVVLRYRGLVAELGRRGLVDDRPSLTAGEMRAAVALTAGMGAPLAEASRRYERVRYGGAAASEDDLAVLERAEGTALRA